MFNGFGQLNVKFGNPIACIVRAKGNFDFVVGVADFRVMVNGLCFKPDADDKADGFSEGTEAKLFHQLIVFKGPARQVAECILQNVGINGFHRIID
jgi:hypothetical protein